MSGGGGQAPALHRIPCVRRNRVRLKANGGPRRPALFYFKLGGKGGIRTLEPGYPSYWFSKPAPSAARPPFLEALLPPGGGGRIRTFGGREPSAVFKTAAFSRSATPPKTRES